MGRGEISLLLGGIQEREREREREKRSGIELNTQSYPLLLYGLYDVFQRQTGSISLQMCRNFFKILNKVFISIFSIFRN